MQLVTSSLFILAAISPLAVSSISSGALPLKSVADQAMGGAKIAALSRNQVTTDDAMWINQGIMNAIQAGKTEYDIPAGTYNIQSNIVIPSGTFNFKLVGAGMDRTILTTPNKIMNQLIRVGGMTVISNNWGLNNLACTSVQNVKQGDTTVTLPVGSTLQAPAYYALFDDNYVLGQAGPDVIRNHVELTYVKSFDPTTGLAVLDQPAAREYTVNPRLSPINSKVCKKITVSNIGFNGTINGDGTDASDGIVQCGLTDVLTLDHLKVRTFGNECIFLNACRNAIITNCDVAGAVSLTIGRGYGISIMRSRFVQVWNSIATDTRHGFICHSGATDVSFNNCQTAGTLSDFDLHGFDERRISYKNCSGDHLAVGNPSWLAGEKDISVTNCSFPVDLYIGPNVNNVYVTGTRIGILGTDSTYNPKAIPAGGYSDLIYFTKCSFNFKSGFLEPCPRIGTFSFNTCYFEQNLPGWGQGLYLPQGTSMDGKLSFLNCAFKTDSLRRGDSNVDVSNVSTRFTLVMRGCSFASFGGAAQAVKTEPGFGGSVDLENNTFMSIGGIKPVFYVNLSGTLANSIGNLAYAR